MSCWKMNRQVKLIKLWFILSTDWRLEEKSQALFVFLLILFNDILTYIFDFSENPSQHFFTFGALQFLVFTGYKWNCFVVFLTKNKSLPDLLFLTFHGSELGKCSGMK